MTTSLFEKLASHKPQAIDTIEHVLRSMVARSSNGVELDALKAMQPEQRAPLIERAQAGEKVSARAAPAQQPAPAHTTISLITAQQSTMQYLLDSTGCTTADDVVSLICATFGDQHPDDDALMAALDPLCVVGHLEPAGVRRVAA